MNTKEKPLNLIVTCDYDWDDQYEAVSMSDAISWMDGHTSAEPEGHDKFRLWSSYGNAAVTRKTQLVKVFKA